MKTNKEKFEHIFKELLSGEFPIDKIINLNKSISSEDFDWIIKFIINLDDPSDYFTKNKKDEEIIKGFFLSIDLTACLSITIGNEAFDKIYLYKNTKSKYLDWVFKYLDDERFYLQLKEKFHFIL